MITETMMLLALKQKNWLHASDMASKLYESRGIPLIKDISYVAGIAETDPRADWLLTLWSELRWDEINKEEDIK